MRVFADARSEPRLFAARAYRLHVMLCAAGILRYRVFVLGAAMTFFMWACASSSAIAPAKPACDIPIEIETTHSLIPQTTPHAEGIFTYRGINYSAVIRNWAGGENYRGTGVVGGISTPAAIEGRYTPDSDGRTWRNQGGVTITVQPPMAIPADPPALEVHFAGALLPREL